MPFRWCQFDQGKLVKRKRCQHGKFARRPSIKRFQVLASKLSDFLGILPHPPPDPRFLASLGEEGHTKARAERAGASVWRADQETRPYKGFRFLQVSYRTSWGILPQTPVFSAERSELLQVSGGLARKQGHTMVSGSCSSVPRQDWNVYNRDVTGSPR
jgi:hypothetical protein